MVLAVFGRNLSVCTANSAIIIIPIRTWKKVKRLLCSVLILWSTVQEFSPCISCNVNYKYSMLLHYPLYSAWVTMRKSVAAHNGSRIFFLGRQWRYPSGHYCDRPSRKSFYQQLAQIYLTEFFCNVAILLIWTRPFSCSYLPFFKAKMVRNYQGWCKRLKVVVAGNKFQE